METAAKTNKTATFRMRIDPDTKAKAEQLFESCGITLTDAVNIFLCQSINAGGLPFRVKGGKGQNGA